YHYLNVAGFKADVVIRDTADAGDNAYAYKYTYHVNGEVETKECYAVGDYADPNSPALSEILAKYEYNDEGVQTGRYTYYYHEDTDNWMESKTLAAADVSGNVYYHWVDENYEEQGYGRLDRLVKDAAEADGTKAYYYEYAGVTGNYSTVVGYALADYSDPKDPDLTRQIKVFVYDKAGNDAANITEQYLYYNDVTNYLQAHMLKAADLDGNLYYHFINENYNSTGQGRLDEKVLGAAEADGTTAYTYTYTGATGNFAEVIGYTTADYSDLSNAVYTTMSKKWVYDGLGNEAANMAEKYTYYTDVNNRMQSKEFADADVDGNVYYHYLNVAGFKADVVIRDSADAGDNAYAYKYTYHVNGEVETKECYAVGNYADPNSPALSEILAKYEYDDTGVQTARYTYYYHVDTDNWMESKTLAAADGSGNVYYHWIDENYSDQGYGRLDRLVKDAAEGDGTKAYYYEYAGVTGNYSTVVGYALADYSDPKDPDLTRQIKVFVYDKAGNDAANIVEQYVYYNDVTNYLEAHMLEDADIDGNVYYHFINENYNSTGQGRLDEKVLGMLEPDSTRAYTYTYAGDTDNYAEVIGYWLADYTDLRNVEYTDMTKRWVYDGLGNEADNMVEKYTYYIGNSLRSATFKTADAEGNLYYHYISDSGLEDYVVRGSADEEDNAWAYRYIYFDGVVANKECYAEGDYADPNDPVLSERLARYEYDTNGVQTMKYTYYYHDDTENWMESKTLAAADEFGNVYYHWIDENYNEQSYGRHDRIVMGAAEADGTKAYYYEYAGVTGNYSTVVGYALADYSDPKDPDLTRKIKSYVYDKAGNDAANIVEQYVYYNDVTNYLEAHMLEDADIDGNVYYHFINENYNGTKQGRLDEKIIAVAEADGTTAYTYTYTGETGNFAEVTGYTTADYSDLSNAVYTTMSKKWVYDGLGNEADNMVEKYAYYTDENNDLQSQTFKTADGSGNVYYHYLNVAGFKADVVVRDTADAGDNAYAYKYTYHVNGEVETKECYAVGNYADPNSPALSEILAKYEYNDEGVQTGRYTYYYHEDTDNWMESKTLAEADGSGNVYYHYLDENWASQGYGRVDKQVRASADGDGAIAYYYEYHSGTNVVSKKICYKTADYSDPKDPEFLTTLVVYEYNSSGSMTVKYTYYDNANNRVESKTMTPAQSGDSYYHYLDESFDHDEDGTVEEGENYGRLDVQVKSSSDGDGAIAYTYTYHGSTKRVNKKECYGSSDLSDPTDPVLSQWKVTYWNYDDANNRMYQKLLANGEAYQYFNDASGRMELKWGTDSAIYHYTNENVLSQGYGYNDWEINAAQDRMIVYRDFYSGTRYPKYKDEYILKAGTTDTWLYAITTIYNPGWVWMEETSDRSSVGNPPAEIILEIPAAPTTGGASSMLLEGEMIGITPEDSVLPEYMEYLTEELGVLKSYLSGEGVTIALLDSGANTPAGK
ncbi:MAG: hypothetical protein PHT95_04755, partial [Candidatus Omnitrophica bacterium]|nr:hypothetical protein [Candidatus Omnitrophota bacterium]